MEIKNKSIWKQVEQKEYDAIMEYNENYKKFLDSARTERLATKEIIQQAKEKGYQSFEEALERGINAGDKIYYNYRNKSAVLMIIGEEELSKGTHIIGAHIDIPRLDLKPNPLYEDGEMALFKSHYYGGIKKYQWTTIPLALYGYVITKNGEEVEIAIGDKEEDPVFYITDLLAHLSKDQGQKKLATGIEGEQLNIVVGHSSYGIDEDENPIKKNILSYLNKHYGMVEEDFLVGEFQVVAATKARDVGFDRAMIAAVGHDDRVCSYAALKAILEVENPKHTAIALFVDKEEIGSVGNTSMNGMFFENMLAELIHRQDKNYSDLLLRRCLANSKVLSADVTVAHDPTYPDVLEKYNRCMAGHGIAIAKYTGSGGKYSCNDANAEFLAEVRNVFAENNIIWQTGELGKVDQGGGGTIAYILAKYGAEVVDAGTPVLSMHAPVELVSKADSYMTKEAYRAFYR
ncbi:MAG: aminopeptidase [Tissierellia bacterium]|nr:aminopeptidase [Tissierellia bacterium]